MGDQHGEQIGDVGTPPGQRDRKSLFGTPRFRWSIIDIMST
ncbi:hypothetical protein L083_3966 [Actinoplanes sp. N902-109]|nr:hypothetical protein L083_3966 [Actinoplanes sp. N902-109]